MSESLAPEGTPVFIGDVVLTTPGLVGRAETYEPASGGMRGAEDLTAAFQAALADAGLVDQVTVEIYDHAEIDGSGGSRSGGGTQIEIDVPGPGDGYGQVLLYAAEDGSLSWHLPDTVAPQEVPTRGGDRRTYTIPREVVPTESAGTSRGLLGALGTKLLKVVVFPLLDPLLGRVGDFFAARWEAQHRRNLLRWMTPEVFGAREAPGLTTQDWSRLAEGPALLFLHGTFSQAHSAFGGLPADARATLSARYGGRVFALDHFTIGPTPRENIRWLAGQLPGSASLTLDVVAHSRGGLVGRSLAERGAELGIPAGVAVRTLVLVATPNAGTVLADRQHLGGLLDRVTNLAQFVIPDNGVTDAIGIVLAILKQVAVGAVGGLDGLMSMNPSGPDLADFNATSPGSTATYRAMAANYEPPSGSPLSRIARDHATDTVFAQAHNDLVVPTAGCYEVAGAAGFPVPGAVVYPAADGIDHCSFFAHPAATRQLLDWLPG